MSYQFAAGELALFNAATDEGVHSGNVVQCILALKPNWLAATETAEAHIKRIEKVYQYGLVRGNLTKRAQRIAEEKKIAYVAPFSQDAGEAFEQIARIFLLSPFDSEKEMTDKNRTEAEEKAIASARSMSAQKMREAGRPASSRGRKARATESTGEGKPGGETGAPMPGATLVVKRPETYAEAYTFALAIRDCLDRFETMNAERVKLGDIGSLFRTYRDGCKTLPKEPELPKVRTETPKADETPKATPRKPRTSRGK